MTIIGLVFLAVTVLGLIVTAWLDYRDAQFWRERDFERPE